MEHLSQFIELKSCPICNALVFKPFIKCIDFTFSKAEFQIVKCSACSFVFTNPRPSEESNGDYYKSPDYISHTNTQKGLSGLLYKFVRRKNLRQKINWISSHVKGKKLLDIGCGTGFFLAKAKACGYDVIGLEPDNNARKFAIENNRVNALPIDSLKDLNKNFDCITMWHVLEHVYHLKSQLTEIVKHLLPNGVFIIAVPNYLSFDSNYYKEYWAGYDAPRHLYHFDQKSIERLMSQFQLSLCKVYPMKYDSYYVSMLSEKNKSGGGLLKAFRVGRKSNRMAMQNIYPYSSQVYVFKNKH